MSPPAPDIGMPDSTYIVKRESGGESRGDETLYNYNFRRKSEDLKSMIIRGDNQSPVIGKRAREKRIDSPLKLAEN